MNLEETGSRPRHSRIARVGVGVGALALGAVVAGAAIAMPAVESQSALQNDDPIWTAPAEADVTPGSPVIVFVGNRTTVVVTGTTTLDLGVPPAEATDVRVAVTCLTAGLVGWGLDPSNTPSMQCTDTDVDTASGTASEDIELSGSSTLHFLADDNVQARIEYQFAILRDTPLGVNDSGETFGADSGPMRPDLILVIGWDDDGRAVEGYSFSADLEHAGPQQPRNPDEVDAYDEAVAELLLENPNGFPVPVYESDGTTRIGTFYVGGRGHP